MRANGRKNNLENATSEQSSSASRTATPSTVEAPLTWDESFDLTNFVDEMELIEISENCANTDSEQQVPPADSNLSQGTSSTVLSGLERTVSPVDRIASTVASGRRNYYRARNTYLVCNGNQFLRATPANPASSIQRLSEFPSRNVFDRAFDAALNRAIVDSVLNAATDGGALPATDTSAALLTERDCNPVENSRPDAHPDQIARYRSTRARNAVPAANRPNAPRLTRLAPASPSSQHLSRHGQQSSNVVDRVSILTPLSLRRRQRRNREQSDESMQRRSVIEELVNRDRENATNTGGNSMLAASGSSTLVAARRFLATRFSETRDTDGRATSMRPVRLLARIPSRVDELRIDPANEESVAVGVDNFAVESSTDSGVDWEDMDAEFAPDVDENFSNENRWIETRPRAAAATTNDGLVSLIVMGSDRSDHGRDARGRPTLTVMMGSEEENLRFIDQLSFRHARDAFVTSERETDQCTTANRSLSPLPPPLQRAERRFVQSTVDQDVNGTGWAGCTDFTRLPVELRSTFEQDDREMLNSRNYGQSSSLLFTDLPRAVELEREYIAASTVDEDVAGDLVEENNSDHTSNVLSAFDRFVERMRESEENMRRRRVCVSELRTMYKNLSSTGRSAVRCSPTSVPMVDQSKDAAPLVRQRMLAILRLSLMELESFHRSIEPNVELPLLRLAGSVFTCDICIERKRGLDFTFNETCVHRQCRSCLREDYRVRFQIANDDYPLPNKPCNICRKENSVYFGVRRFGDTYKLDVIRYFSQL